MGENHTNLDIGEANKLDLPTITYGISK
jgi:hypothetical protein